MKSTNYAIIGVPKYKHRSAALTASGTTPERLLLMCSQSNPNSTTESIPSGAINRFWKYVDKSGGTEKCWRWIGSTTGGGYGKLHLTGDAANRVTIMAHRFSLWLFSGEHPGDMHVLHSCDTPSCVNPRHLFLGTHSDNMRDMIAKGRGGDTAHRGEDNHFSKLTESQVMEIRKTYKPHHREFGGVPLARKFGITPNYVRTIIRGDAWSHLDDDGVPTERYQSDFKVGDPCPKCGKRLVIDGTRLTETYRYRYIGCRKSRGGCGFRDRSNRELLPERDETLHALAVKAGVAK